jgi:predicted RNase H-like HicB family nuclease
MEIDVTYYIGIVDGKDDVWGVRIPDLPGCLGGGPTADAAIADATSAASEWAAYMIAKGYPINPPRDRQAIVNDPDVEYMATTESTHLIPLIINRFRPVKANISLDAGILETIDAAAKSRGLTRSTFMVGAALEKITQQV